MLGWLPCLLANLTRSCQFFILPIVGLPSIGNAKCWHQTNYPHTMQKFRPICLLPVVFKMFPKALDERLKPFMTKLISRNQNAFNKGRNIMDGVMSLHEILHEAKVRNNKVWC